MRRFVSLNLTPGPRMYAVCTAVLIGALPRAASADLLSFCTGSQPTDPTAAATYAAQCPAYLQSQFANASSQQAQAEQTTKLSQQQTQAATLSSLAALSKAASPTAPGDLAGVSSLAQRQDALLTYRIAQAIGKVVGPEIKSTKGTALLISPADASMLFGGAVEADSLLAVLADYRTALGAWQCRVKPPGPAKAALPAVVGTALGINALLSALATTTSLFQPSLLSATAVKPVADPQFLIAAGVVNGAGENGALILLRAPSIKATNPVLFALSSLRADVAKLEQEAAACAGQDDVKRAGALIADITAFVAAIGKSDAGKPSTLEVAVRRSSLNAEGVKATLLISRDLGGGGVALLKPSAFSSQRLLFGSAVGLTYQLVGIDSTLQKTGMYEGSWNVARSVDEWATVSSGEPKVSAVPDLAR